MPMSVTCPSCNSSNRIPDGSAGKKVRCHQCKSVFVPSIPAPEPARAATGSNSVLILAGAAVFFVLGACGVGSVATYLLWPRTPVQVVNAPLAKQQPIIEVKKPPVIEEKKTETTKRVPNFGPNKAPETKVVGNTLDAKRRYPRDIDEFATSLNDVTLRKIVPSIYTHTPLWHPDGKSLYVVQLHSHIMRLDAEDFSILKDRIYYEDKKPVYIRGGLTHSSEGLLALGSVDHALKGEDIHLIILDPETFLPAKKIPCPNAGLVLSAPNLSIAFVGGKNTYSDGGKQGDLRIVNLKSGAVEKLDLGFDFNPQSFQVSPDGQAFFGTDGKSLVRFRIDGGKLAHVDTSAVLVDNNRTARRREPRRQQRLAPGHRSHDRTCAGQYAIHAAGCAQSETRVAQSRLPGVGPRFRPARPVLAILGFTTDVGFFDEGPSREDTIQDAARQPDRRASKRRRGAIALRARSLPRPLAAQSGELINRRRPIRDISRRRSRVE